MRAVPQILTIAGMAVAFAACGSDGGKADPDPDPQVDAGPTGIDPVAPSSVSMVASGGFEGPMDAVASPDGETFYFSAYDTSVPEGDQSRAAIFSVASSGGTPSVLSSGAPLEDPSGLVLSCDGATLFVADLGSQSQDADAENVGASPIYSITTSGGALTAFSATGVGEAAGLAISTDCSTLYVAGYKEDGTPAVFTVPVAGGSATILKEGAPLESPSGVHVDANDIAWVMDHKNSDATGGALWAIDTEGTTTEVASGLQISEPAGVSLVAGGRIAVIPTKNAEGEGQLLTIDTVSGEETIVDAPEMQEPAGIRTATNAPVMAVVDADGDAIFRAE